MKKLLLILAISCLNIIGCDFNFNEVPSTIVSYDLGFGFYEPCCYPDIIYYYKVQN